MLTQLCLAVALLALHMESWLTVVPDLISNLTTPPEQAAVKLPCLLELLTVLLDDTPILLELRAVLRGDMTTALELRAVPTDDATIRGRADAHELVAHLHA